MANIANHWSFHKHHVQEGEVTSGKFLSAESVLIGAGPEKLPGGNYQAVDQLSDFFSADGSRRETTAVFPIGIVENVSISQNKQVQRLFEIGSSLSYFIPGRTVGNMSISRVHYHGENLLRALYASYDSTNAQNDFDALTTREVTQVDVQANPGYGGAFVNFASDLFNRPFGMMIYAQDANENPAYAMYVERCHPVSSQKSINAGSVLIMEGVAFQFEQIVPIRLFTEGLSAQQAG